MNYLWSGCLALVFLSSNWQLRVPEIRSPTAFAAVVVEHLALYARSTPTLHLESTRLDSQPNRRSWWAFVTRAMLGAGAVWSVFYFINWLLCTYLLFVLAHTHTHTLTHWHVYKHTLHFRFRFVRRASSLVRFALLATVALSGKLFILFSLPCCHWHCHCHCHCLCRNHWLRQPSHCSFAKNQRGNWICCENLCVQMEMYFAVASFKFLDFIRSYFLLSSLICCLGRLN